MRLTALLPPLLTDPVIAGLVADAGRRRRTDRSAVVAAGARPAVLAAMAYGEDGVARAVGAAARETPARPVPDRDAAAREKIGRAHV